MAMINVNYKYIYTQTTYILSFISMALNQKIQIQNPLHLTTN